MLALGDGELVGDEKFVILRMLEIDQPDLVALYLAIADAKLNIDAFGDQPMDPAVLFH